MWETWVRSLGWEDPLEDYPLQYPGLENSMDCIVRGVAKTQTRLSDFHLTSLQCPLCGIKEHAAGSVYFRWGWMLSFYEEPALADACHFLPSAHAQKMERTHDRFHTMMGGREEPGKMVFQHLSGLVLGNTLLFWFSLEKPLLVVVWGERWKEGSGGRGYGSTYGWFLLMYDRKPHNSVKQLSFS